MIFKDSCRVFTAASYAEAVGLIENHASTFDVAMVDLRLNDADNDNEDGMQILQCIQEARCGTRTIILTGYPDLAMTGVALRDLGAFDYLEKYPSTDDGLDIDHLQRVVRRAIGEP
jgi:ActR/RegA family two-component response regulator